MNIKSFEHIYLIGIGGIGMSALAKYFMSQDKKVYGYDKVKTSLTIALEKQGVEISYKDDVSTIPMIFNKKHYDNLVVYSSAITENKIFSFFSSNSFTICKRAEVLGLISKYYYTIAVAGTHGKTTTSIMLSHILKHSNVDCTAFFGGISKNYNSNFLLSKKSKYMVVEADEYDKSFLTLNPDIAIITSLDSDHLDIYENHDAFVNAFQQFIYQVKDNGYLIIEESIVDYFEKPKNVKLFTYSNSSASDYYISEINQEKESVHFNYCISGKDSNSKKIILPMFGSHNVSNALAAILTSNLLEINYEDIFDSFCSFEGINRRFDIHVSNCKSVYLDDYAHHPEEIQSTIDSVKELFPNRKLTVIFQPHLFSRTKDFAGAFAKSLSQADELILLDIYPAREKPILGVDSSMLLNLCTNEFKRNIDKDEVLYYLENKENDVVLTLGAGDICDLVNPIKSILG